MCIMTLQKTFPVYRCANCHFHMIVAHWTFAIVYMSVSLFVGTVSRSMTIALNSRVSFRSHVRGIKCFALPGQGVQYELLCSL